MKKYYLCSITSYKSKSELVIRKLEKHFFCSLVSPYNYRQKIYKYSYSIKLSLLGNISERNLVLSTYKKSESTQTDSWVNFIHACGILCKKQLHFRYLKQKYDILSFTNHLL